VLRQLRGPDRMGRGAAASSRQTRELRPRTAEADRVVGSVCPTSVSVKWKIRQTMQKHLVGFTRVVLDRQPSDGRAV
jgi:hypothetical protein